jgi:hypothetical protein
MRTTNGNTFDSAYEHARPLALDVAVDIGLDALGARRRRRRCWGKRRWRRRGGYRY